MPLVVTLKFYMEFQKDRFRGLYLKIVVTYFFDIIECDIASYADDNTPYKFDFSLDDVRRNLEKCIKSSLIWYRENQMRTNADKCHCFYMITASVIKELKRNSSRYNARFFEIEKFL